MSRHTHSHPPVSVEGLECSANGVSVVIASSRSPAVTLQCLESLAAQSLDAARYEMILVVNGPQADDVTEYESFARSNPHLRLVIVRSPLAGASHAWNLGISSARMPWMTIVDDDDTVTPGYLEGLLTVAAPGVIPITGIDDVLEDGTVNHDNRLNEQIVPLRGRSVPPEDCFRGLTFNTAKLIPTDWARHIMYDEHLRSGQDIAFFGGLYARYDFRFAVVPERFHAVYLRALTDTSMSRRDMDFDFAVAERLGVVEMLDGYRRGAPAHKQELLATLQRSQAGFTRRYLDENPAERGHVTTTIRALGVATFPWEVLTSGAATTLVVSVCFPPYADPSATTVAKRIAQTGVVVDVLSCDMSAVRPIDPSLHMIADGWVDTVSEVMSNMPFSDWAGYRRFVTAGWKTLQRHRSWPYDSLYSRAMWPASHILAASIKVRRPGTRWVAEFSDPLSRDVRGDRRRGSLPRDDLVEELIHAASRVSGVELSPPATVFDLAELLPYALADEVVFTNENQQRYMLSYLPSGKLAEQVASRAVIRPHPVPSPELYHVVDAEGPTRPDVANLAYFGSFYENRSLSDLLHAISQAPGMVRSMLALDVFTTDQATIQRVVERNDLQGTVSIRPAVEYLEFLNLTTRYDCLVVEDAHTVDSHAANPYLPSKWSDYRGSGTPIWAFTEEGSTLSLAGTDYASRLGNPDEAARVLADVVTRFATHDASSAKLPGVGATQLGVGGRP